MKKKSTKSIPIQGLWIFGLFAVFHLAANGQASHDINVANYAFTPDEITVTVGDTVTWTNTQGTHNVNGTKTTFPSNPESFGNTVGSGWIFSHVFSIPGTYDYHCDPHASFGMVGKVIVEEQTLYNLTVNFSGMTPHIGQNLWLAVIDENNKDEIARVKEVVSESFSVVIPGIEVGKSYSIDFFADFNGNGYYDAPPADHAWRLEIANVSGDEAVDFTHNIDFTDIQWRHRLKVHFSGMNPHLNEMLTLFVREKTTGNYLDTVVVEQIDTTEFDVFSYVIEPGESYLVDFYADHNGNGVYDAPPADHAWRIETGLATGDVDLTFEHHTNFTDILPTPAADVRLSEDPELGMILTDAEGYTLYYFTRDALPDTSFCTGGCVTNWPLFYAADLTVGEGLDSADFSSIEHPDVGMQTTYKGWPLYYFNNDLNPGETNGEAVGNVWFVAKPDYSIMLMDNVLVGQDGVTYNSSYEPGEEVVQYFVDGSGRTLYIFINDNFNQNNFTNPDFSNDAVWPIYEEGLGSVASTLDRSMFDSINVFGRRQLTYNGWPLYYFGGDSLRGDTKGVSVPSPGIWPVAMKNLEMAVTSVDDPTFASGLQIYPNPAPEEVYIKSPDIIESISIINMTGAEVLIINDVQATESIVSLSGISSGVYYVKVKTADHTTRVSRLVRQ
jgi:predicted lipoprotein with Yx(FWY)xxD motif/plastocyanin